MIAISKINMKVRKLHDPKYDIDLTFVIGTPEELLQVFPDSFPDQDQKMIDNINGKCIGYTTKIFGMYTKSDWIIWLRHEDDVQALVHEISHLAVNIFTEKNIDFMKGKSETFAQYTESWFTKMYPELKINQKYVSRNYNSSMIFEKMSNDTWLYSLLITFTLATWLYTGKITVLLASLFSFSLNRIFNYAKHKKNK